MSGTQTGGKQSVIASGEIPGCDCSRCEPDGKIALSHSVRSPEVKKQKTDDVCEKITEVIS